MSLIMLALISGESAIGTLVWVVCIGIVFWLLFWLVGYCALPEPFNKVARVLLALAAVVILINIVMGFAGHPFFRF